MQIEFFHLVQIYAYFHSQLLKLISFLFIATNLVEKKVKK